MNKLKVIPFAVAAAWAIAASLYIVLTPTTITEVIAETTPGTPQSIQHATRQISWYGAQGWRGILVLLIFVLLFSGAWVFAARAHYGLLAISSFLAVTLTLLATFSIGPLYYPAVLAVIFGWVLVAFEILHHAKLKSSG